MAKLLKYKATKNGCLNNPYRYVEKGEVIGVVEPIEASWLVPEEEFVPEPVLPITSTTDQQMINNAQQPNTVPPVASNPSYDTAMQDVVAREKQQDALAAQQNTPPAAPASDTAPAPAAAPQVMAAPQAAPQTEVASQPGTGDQDVL